MVMAVTSRLQEMKFPFPVLMTIAATSSIGSTLMPTSSSSLSSAWG
jgi:hypothetical protein